MPELSRFYGIIITMFAEVGGRHHLPHFHASYQDCWAMDYSIMHSVQSFEIVAPYTIKMQFENGAIRTIDFRHVLGGELLRPLRDTDFFARAKLSEGIPTLTWPSGADFNPYHLYNWQKYEKLYIERAQKWEKQESTVPSEMV